MQQNSNSLSYIFKRSAISVGHIDQIQVRDFFLAVLFGVFTRIKTRGPGFYIVRHTSISRDYPITSGIIRRKEETTPSSNDSAEVHDELDSVLSSAIKATSNPKNPAIYINHTGRNSVIALRTMHSGIYSCAYHDTTDEATDSRAGLAIAEAALYLLSETLFGSNDELRSIASAMLNHQSLPILDIQAINYDFEQYAVSNGLLS